MRIVFARHASFIRARISCPDFIRPRNRFDYIKYARIIINPFDFMIHTLLFKIFNLNLKKQRLFIKSDVSNSRGSCRR